MHGRSQTKLLFYIAIGTGKALGAWTKDDAVKLATALRAALAQIDVAHS